MNGPNWAGQALIGGATVWRVVGAADFNGDGKADVLWQHPSTGELWVWYLNGTIWTGQSQISPPTLWKVVGTGDFNGDGKPDILWQLPSTSELWVWFMNGAAYSSAAQIGAGLTGFPWKVVGAGDFNADSRPDILWQHPSTGEVWVWFMNGAAWTGQAQINPGTQWKVAGIGDFNGDGKPDILWQLPPPGGDLWVWFMNGSTYAGAAPIEGTTVWTAIGGSASIGIQFSAEHYATSVPNRYQVVVRAVLPAGGDPTDIEKLDVNLSNANLAQGFSCHVIAMNDKSGGPVTSVLQLMDDLGEWWPQPHDRFTPGLELHPQNLNTRPGALLDWPNNSQCTLREESSSLTFSGTTMTMTFSLEMKPASRGPFAVVAQATCRTGVNTCPTSPLVTLYPFALTGVD